jgi:glucose-6-phosphate isomerase
MRILVLEVADANCGTKNNANIVVGIGGQGLGPNMVVIALSMWSMNLALI